MPLLNMFIEEEGYDIIGPSMGAWLVGICGSASKKQKKKL